MSSQLIGPVKGHYVLIHHENNELSAVPVIAWELSDSLCRAITLTGRQPANSLILNYDGIVMDGDKLVGDLKTYMSDNGLTLRTGRINPAPQFYPLDGVAS